MSHTQTCQKPKYIGNKNEQKKNGRKIAIKTRENAIKIEIKINNSTQT